MKKIFVEAVGLELRDILSNMMNNSIEAGASAITIKVERANDYLKCSFIDNGHGIDKDIQKKIFDRGFTSGKKSGTGYGLFHAQKFIESWGGSFDLIDSSKGKTTFAIYLPIWAIPELSIESAKTIVILDDEDSVHKKWKRKISSVNPTAEVLSFKSHIELYNWFEEQDDFSSHLFFFDSDLGEGSTITGEKIIEELGLESIAHLVTNNYNSPKLALWCRNHSISLLPKGTL